MALEGIDFRVDAVLPAGGIGQRMGLETPKQFVKVCGRSLICYALDTFESVPWIKKIAVPVSKEWTSHMEQIIKEEGYSKIVLCEGKHTRHRSIYEGVKSLEAEDGSPHVVIIHDAVRPLIDEDILVAVAKAANEHGASGAVRKLVSTILVTDKNEMLDHSLVRSKCRASEMPQAFQYNVISEAYLKSSEDDFDNGTECLHLALEYTWAKPKLVEGTTDLWKVTYQNDLETFEKTIKERTRKNISFWNIENEAPPFWNQIIEFFHHKGYKTSKILKTDCEIIPSSEESSSNCTSKFGSHQKPSLVCFADYFYRCGKEIEHLQHNYFKVFILYHCESLAEIYAGVTSHSHPRTCRNFQR
ncbi:D-ribitol-5-phosphate cytidylyltransferase-like isoform X2 [Rhopilema esculentum]|uniref:D-ribitol-5-phosphate cytidylyltransferase-like isoform X2 n=1 Tax=Rhopilema esculentum TaxID=499914 RepID=UPI0031D418A3